MLYVMCYPNWNTVLMIFKTTSQIFLQPYLFHQLKLNSLSAITFIKAIIAQPQTEPNHKNTPNR